MTRRVALASVWGSAAGLAAQLRGQQQRRRPPSDADVAKSLPPGVRFTPDVAYDSKSEKQKLDLYTPPGPVDGARPGLVVVHGGGWRGGDKRGGQWSGIPAEYAERGYVTISVNYRLTDEAPFPAQVQDVKAAVRWLRAHAEEHGVDPERIGAYGNSAGAHLVSLLGLAGPEAKLEGDGPHLDQSSRVQAVCASATPTDFLNWGRPRYLPERLAQDFFRGSREGLETRARAASPITYVRADAPPMLLIHGTADRTVPISQSQAFVEALRKAGAREVRYMILDNEGHGVFQSQRVLTYPAMQSFFAEALG